MVGVEQNSLVTSVLNILEILVILVALKLWSDNCSGLRFLLHVYFISSSRRYDMLHFRRHRSEEGSEFMLHLKDGAPVMVICNLSSTFVNGLQEIVRSLESISVSVYFSTLEESLKLTKHMFTVYDQKAKRYIAFQKQIPLRLSFALTVHKSQGMTIDRFEIDCHHMRNAGKIGVAVGRAP